MSTDNIRFTVPPVRPVEQGKPQAAQRTVQGTPFAHVWQETLQKQDSVRFSAHALQRLEDRKIKLEAKDLAKINEAVDAAGKKGSRSSLLIFQDMALVASVKNKTIITAMGGADMRDHVFTNIDSAVIIP